MPITAPVPHSPQFHTPDSAALTRLRRMALLFAVLAMAAGATAAAPGAAAAQTPALAQQSRQPDDIDDEGGSAHLREQLDEASRGYLDAKNALDNSVKRQRQLDEQLKALAAEVTARSQTVDRLADVAYRTGRLAPLSALLDSGSPSDFLSRAAALSSVATKEQEQVRELHQTQQSQARAKAAIDHEIREQRRQVQVMAKRKQQAERALALAGSRQSSPGVRSSGGGTSTSGGTARPAPRNSDGSWPRESCSVDDPTTSGCITPRTRHALAQAKAAGFTRYVSCYRSGGSGEHPKGRACDFAAQKNGFGGAATGGDRTYGDRLTSYLVRNANRLGVLYVIWYRQIWLPSSGWKVYHGSGSPSSEHTNHVHLSMH